MKRPFVWGLALALLGVIGGGGAPQAAVAAGRTVEAVATTGQSAPVTGSGAFSEFDEPIINNGGDVVFVAEYSTGVGVFLPREGT